MKGAVIIPCWKRPEFLGACLYYIQQADGWNNYVYLFAVDNHREPGKGYDPEVLDVIYKFTGQKVIKVREPHKNHGNSYNVLQGYLDALELDIPGLIHLIETDIFIGKDYFTFHEHAHALSKDAFFVSACRNQNNGRHKDLPQDPTAVYPFNRYQSLGNSFKPATLATYIAEHCRTEYWGNMLSYCKKHFPRSEFGRSLPVWWEQDGLINRIMERDNLHGLFPNVPRAYHAGFHGYNRKGKPLPPTMPLSQRIASMLEMTEEEMNARALNKSYRDITKCDLGGHDAPDLHIVTNGALPGASPH